MQSRPGSWTEFQSCMKLSQRMILRHCFDLWIGSNPRKSMLKIKLNHYFVSLLFKEHKVHDRKRKQKDLVPCRVSLTPWKEDINYQ